MVEEAKDLTPQSVKEEIPDGSDGQVCLDHVQLHDVFHVTLESPSNSDCEDSLTLERERFKTKVSELNSFVEDEDCSENEESQSRKHIITPNGNCESIVAWDKNAKLYSEKEVAFHILASAYVLTFMKEAEENCVEMSATALMERKRALELLARRRENLSGPIHLFVTGPAGAGKCKYHCHNRVKRSFCAIFTTNKMYIAKLLDELETCARGYSATVGHVLTRDSIKITALTGAAATEIGGETTAREFALEKHQPSFSETRLCVIDEISFLSYADLGKVSLRLHQFTECTEHNFGKDSTVLLGDFCQLHRIGKCFL